MPRKVLGAGSLLNLEKSDKIELTGRYYMFNAGDEIQSLIDVPSKCRSIGTIHKVTRTEPLYRRFYYKDVNGVEVYSTRPETFTLLSRKLDASFPPNMLLGTSLSKAKCCSKPRIVKNHALFNEFHVCKNCKKETDKDGFAV